MPPFVQTVQPFIGNSDKGRRGLSGYFLLLRGVVKFGVYGLYLDVRMKKHLVEGDASDFLYLTGQSKQVLLFQVQRPLKKRPERFQLLRGESPLLTKVA